MMSAKNRVNPDYYKLAGRDPQDRIPPLRDKQLFARQHAMDGGPAGTFIPGGGHAPGAMGMKQGMASGSKKAATSHSGTRSMASTRPVAGAFGREGAGPSAKRKTKSATTPTKARGTKRTTKKARGKTKRAA